MMIVPACGVVPSCTMPEGLLSLVRMLINTGFAWSVMAVSSAAIGVIRLSSSSMTLSMMILPSFALKPRRSKYKVRDLKIPSKGKGRS